MLRRSRALAAVGLIWGIAWAVFGLAALPGSAVLRITCASGLSALWVGLLCLGCLGTALLAVRLGRQLPPGQDRVQPAAEATPEPAAV